MVIRTFPLDLRRIAINMIAKERRKMKKNIITYIISCIALILTRILVYSIMGRISLMAFVVINLICPSLIIIIANAVINYDKSSTIKKCLLHAVVLAALSLTVNLGATQLVGDKAVDNLIGSEKTENKESEEPDQEIMDELDRQARQKMIDEGLISEDEEIYSEPYGNSQKIDGGDESDEANRQLTGTWDVQVEKENTLSTVTGALLDIVLAFIGGMAGATIRKRKHQQ